MYKLTVIYNNLDEQDFTAKPYKIKQLWEMFLSQDNVTRIIISKITE